ncbi:tetratricopeptide repeat protein [Bathymodiolus septemdierum thioautotrophic gill symbiont]|uniref:Uncharacterized protein n=1 Tax=endosymbiont of Bathymodiolus septemdierum str. Myojin knoll TaxID=1303921 RepID=A0A0P0URQ1_9GAMM|nr:ATP-binding protein [Bathymodiolus septemdierum thioautotrophic gill symbiont]BAS67525.1 hypothetical protein BSEPE_0516 [endosymbiont of Bathymodiolus septemdierum str. Myojin knoll]
MSMQKDQIAEALVNEFITLWKEERGVAKQNLIKKTYEELGLPKIIIRIAINLLEAAIKSHLEDNKNALIKKAKDYPSIQRLLCWFLTKIKGEVPADKLDDLNTKDFFDALQDLENSITQNLSWNPILTFDTPTKNIEEDIIKQLHAHNKYHTYIGREKSKNILQTFLEQDAAFSWMGIVGDAGSGKTRFAHEFGQIAQQQYWRVGFLGKSSLQSLEQLQNWQPIRPTLIFIDYAKDHVDEVQRLLNALATKSWDDGVLVRLVLIDRSGFKVTADNQIEDHINARRFTDFKGLVESDNLVLTPLEDNDIRRLIRQFEGINVEQVLKKVKQKHYQAKPLYILLLCIQKEQGEQADIEDILAHLLKRQGRLPWDTENDDNAVEVSQAIQIATLFGEFTSQDFSAIQVNPTENSKKQKIMKAAAIITKQEDDVLKPLEPDLLGEYFALALMDFLSKQGLSLDSTLFEKDLNYYEACIKRCHDDFPEKLKALRSYLIDPLKDDTVKQDIEAYLEPNADTLFEKHLNAVLTNNFEEARKVFEQLTTLAKDYPNNQEMQLALAKAAFNWLSGLNKNPADFKEARKVFEQLTTLAKDHPNNQEMQLALAKAAVNWLSGLSENPKEARKVFEQSTTLAKDHPNNQEMQLELAKAAVNWLSGLSENPADFKEARKVFEQLTTLAKDHSNNQEMQLELAKAAFNWLIDLLNNDSTAFVSEIKQTQLVLQNVLQGLVQQVDSFKPGFAQEVWNVCRSFEKIESLKEIVKALQRAIQAHFSS